jgi:hypothetical protein
MFEAAMADANEKDKQKERGQELVGAFWGLPSTFKGREAHHLGSSLHCRRL